jgi:CrcB protein
MKDLFPILVVGVGGFVGSVVRYLLSLAAASQSLSFPHGTLWSNLLGCFVIGVVSSVAAATDVLSPTMRLLLATGFCGGFTTMSSFVYEMGQFLRQNEYWFAGVYLLLTWVGCAVMFWLGSQVLRPWMKV